LRRLLKEVLTGTPREVAACILSRSQTLFALPRQARLTLWCQRVNRAGAPGQPRESGTKPAKFLVFFVKQKGAPTTLPAK
jgi:hypothetical protein